MASVQKTIALIVGIVLLLIGIAGFIDNALIGDSGYFGTNATQDVLHLIAGAFGVYAGTKWKGKNYNLTIGWIGIVLGVLGFIPGIANLLADLLNINTEITVLHLVLGIVLLVIGYSVKR